MLIALNSTPAIELEQMPRVASFTEAALLNRVVLDWLSPPNCEKVKIRQETDSIVSALAHPRILEGKVDNSYLHWGTKVIRYFARFVYTSLVTTIVSPLGVLWYGACITRHLSCFVFAAFTKNSSLADSSWEKCNRYAEAFFSDFKSFALGGLLPCITVISLLKGFPPGGPIWDTTELNGIRLVLEVLGIISHLTSFFTYTIYYQFYLIANNHAQPFAEMIMPKNLQVEMSLALELRNQLGLVDENGGLLHFSKMEKLSWEALERNVVFKQLKRCCYHAEISLVEVVRQANAWLQKKGKEELTCQYPFNGNDIAQLIKEVVGEDDQGDLYADELIQKLEYLQQKIMTLRGLHQKAAYIAGWVLPEDINYVTSISMIYEKVFTGEISEQDAKKIMDYDPLTAFYNQINLKAINPEQTSCRSDRIYDRLKYELQVNKWKLAQREQAKDQFELIGLTFECTFEEYTAAKKKYQQVLHPDLHPGNEAEATTLFQAFQAIIEHINIVRDFA